MSKKSRYPWGLIALGCAGLAVAAAPVTFIVWLTFADPFGMGPHPTDAALLSQFQKHRETLERLAGMIAQDPGLQRVAANFTRPADPASIGVTPERIALYRLLCDKAGIAGGIADYGQGVVFLANTRGTTVAGSGKGFVWRTMASEDAIVVEDDLDEAAAALPEKKALLLKKIDGNWWLQLEMR
jgi:hypothetical protein